MTSSVVNSPHDNSHLLDKFANDCATETYREIDCYNIFVVKLASDMSRNMIYFLMI